MPSTLIPNLLKTVVITINQTIYLRHFVQRDMSVFERFYFLLLLFWILNAAIILFKMDITMIATKI